MHGSGGLRHSTVQLSRTGSSAILSSRPPRGNKRDHEDIRYLCLSLLREFHPCHLRILRYRDSARQDIELPYMTSMLSSPTPAAAPGDFPYFPPGSVDRSIYFRTLHSSSFYLISCVGELEELWIPLNRQRPLYEVAGRCRPVLTRSNGS